MLRLLQIVAILCLIAPTAMAQPASPVVHFDVRSAKSGKWSDAATWVGKHVPGSGDSVQVRSGHVVTYDVNSEDAVRVLHVAGTLRFARNKSTRLNVGLLKVQPGEECREDGFNCHEMADVPDVSSAKMPNAVLEIGTQENPIPAGVTATLR